MMKNSTECQTLCTSEIPPENAKFLNNRIREDYALNWLIDGLPAGEKKYDQRNGDVFFDMGFNLGKDDGQFELEPALNNHYEIVLKYVCLFVSTEVIPLLIIIVLSYHSPEPDTYRIVGVLVWPSRYDLIST